MPHAKNQTAIWFKCTKCGSMMNPNRVNTKYNPKNKKLKLRKYCRKCNEHQFVESRTITSKGSTKGK